MSVGRRENTLKIVLRAGNKCATSAEETAHEEAPDDCENGVLTVVHNDDVVLRGVTEGHVGGERDDGIDDHHRGRG